MYKSEELVRLGYYILERERIRLARQRGDPFPWTEDKILQTYKFTNVHRLHDRTTQAMLKLYEELNYPAADHLLLAGAFRYFGTAAYAENLVKQIQVDKQWGLDVVEGVAKTMEAAGEQIFTGAYIITNGGKSGSKVNTVMEFLVALEKEAPAIVNVMRDEQSWKEGYKLLTKVPGFGGKGFMAKEVLQDWLLLFDGAVLDGAIWTPVGPGARRGVNRLREKPIPEEANEARFVDEVLKIREAILPEWHEHFPTDPLTAHDVQFVMCEFDKYERTRLGEGRPRSMFYPPGSKERDAYLHSHVPADAQADHVEQVATFTGVGYRVGRVA